jgi:hypothetical protein
MTEPALNVADLVQKDRKAFAELRQIVTGLLLEKVRPEERAALLRAAADERGFRLTPADICAITAHARRSMQGRAHGAGVGDQFDIPDEVWSWDQIIAGQTPNLLVALQKVGKTALITGLISAWHYGTGDFLGYQLHGPCPPVIIAGPDQTIADWRGVLAPAGLMQKNSSDKWELLPNGPIKRLWYKSNPVYLDEQGIEDIAAQCEQHPGALLFCDTYATLIAPLGLDEAKPEAAEPLYNLMEAVEPFHTTPVLNHHASKSRANERASNASRNSNAIPAAVSQIISLQWLEPDKKSDQRINLTTEGRNSKPVDLVIEQIERSQWISHGSTDDIKQSQRLVKAEANLSDRQTDALDILRDRWERDRQETTPPQLLALMETEYQGDARKARATLQQLFDKGLADKRNDIDPEAGGTVIRYRPIAADLLASRAGLQKHPPQPPQPPLIPLGIPRQKPSPQSLQLNSEESPEAAEAVFRAPREGELNQSPTPPSLNGNASAVWAVIWAAKDGEAPHTLSLRIETETGTRMNGAQLKALIAQGPPPELKHLEPF